jgi:DNA-binding MarR family transcriptional regulator
MDDEATRAAVPAEVVVEELVTLILDHLVPAVGWYRDQVAHRLGLGPAALTVLEQAGRRPTTASRCAGWTGMTPSAMAKVVRRLEAAGHVVRSPSGRHEQELFVELVPHPERDRLAAHLRENVRWSMRHLVATLGLTDSDRHLVAANAVVHAATALSARANQLARQEGDRRLLVRRRKARAVLGDRR